MRKLFALAHEGRTFSGFRGETVGRTGDCDECSGYNERQEEGSLLGDLKTLLEKENWEGTWSNGVVSAK